MDFDDYPVFRNNKKSLQYTSRDTDKDPVQFMTLDTRKVIDFDSVKTSVISKGFNERVNISFILVYNKEAKNITWETSLALHKAMLGRTGLKTFGTDKFRGFSYKDVFMVEKREFDDFLRKI